jgi:hypothetical protein
MRGSWGTEQQTAIWRGLFGSFRIAENPIAARTSGLGSVMVSKKRDLVEGRNPTIELRGADDREERLTAFAADLVREQSCDHRGS